jgi:anti-sigma B factor antagonist
MAEARALKLHITHDTDNAVTVVHAAGDLDLTSGPRLHAALQPTAAETVILDAAEVTFCDSAGLKAILQTNHESRARGTVLRIAAVSEPLARVLQLAGAFKALEVFPDVPAALAAQPSRKNGHPAANR